MEETAQVRVRPLVATDLAAYQHILAYPAMAVANGATSCTAPDLLAYWFEKDRHSPYAFAVIERRTHHFVGAILYYQRQAQTDIYDLGYFLDPHVWGHGLMPAAVQQSWRLIQRADGDLRALYADCLPQNHRSLRVLAKLGFYPVEKPAAEETEQVPLDARWFKRDF